MRSIRCILSLWILLRNDVCPPGISQLSGASYLCRYIEDIIIIHRNNPTTFVHPNLTEWAIQRVFAFINHFTCIFLGYLIIFLPVIITLHWTDSGRVRVIRTQSPSSSIQCHTGNQSLAKLSWCRFHSPVRFFRIPHDRFNFNQVIDHVCQYDVTVSCTDKQFILVSCRFPPVRNVSPVSHQLQIVHGTQNFRLTIIMH